MLLISGKYRPPLSASETRIWEQRAESFAQGIIKEMKDLENAEVLSLLKELNENMKAIIL